MKKLLYFSILFCILFICFSLTYAGQCGDDAAGPAYTIDRNPSYDGSLDFVGIFYGSGSAAEAENAIEGYYFPSPYGQCNDYSNAAKSVIITFGEGVTGYNYIVRAAGFYTDSPMRYAIYTSATNSEIICAPPPPLDTDGDGIYDEFDLNGSSTEQYNAAIKTLVYDTSTGEVAAGEILLDNGTVFSFGSIPQDFEGYSIDEFTGSFLEWKSGVEAQELLSSINIDGSTITQRDSIEIDESGYITGTNDGPDLDVQESNDDNFVASTSSDGTETDNQALQKIVDNTANSSNNIQRLGDYLSDINKNLKSIDTSTAITTNNTTNSNSTTTTTTQEISNDGIDQIAEALGTSSEIASAKSQSDSDLSGIDTSDESFSYENSNERTTLQNEISAMSSDGTLSTLIEENTGDITTLDDFKNSGISIVNPTSVIQMDLGPFGQHTIDFGLDIFQSFYAAIAAFLYPFTILLSYFIILKG